MRNPERDRSRRQLQALAGLPVIALGMLLLTGEASAEVENAPEPMSAQTPARIPSFEEDIDGAMRAIGVKDYPRAAALFSAAIGSPGFDALPEPKRYLAIEGAAESMLLQDKDEAAYPFLLRATAMDSAGDAAWYNRMAAAYALKKFPDVAHCLETIARRWPKTLDSDISGGDVRTVFHALDSGDAPDPALFGMLDALYDAHWKGGTTDPSDLWRGLTRMLLARHQVDKAKAVAADIGSTRIALSMRVDRTFDAVTVGNPHFDIDRLALDNVERARHEVEAQPRKLQNSSHLMIRLLDAMRYDEALRLADDIIAKSADGRGASHYDDFDGQYNWILDERQGALIRLGRWDEAVNQLERAARHPENGQTNVSQVINLSLLYDGLGRPADARKTMLKMELMSPYGQMQLEYARLWAAVQLHDDADTAVHLGYMRAHSTDAISTWNQALLTAGKTDEAAAVLIERLHSNSWRSKALEEMQHYGEVRRAPLDAAFDQQWLALGDRPDVKTALAAVGRVEKFQIDPEQR